MLAWEMVGPGTHFGKRVMELGYRNVYYRKNEANLGINSTQSDVAGWYPSNDNRRILLEEYRAALNGRDFINRCFMALEECLAFIFTAQGTVKHDGDPESFDTVTGKADPSGAGANHGDRVIADALAWKMCAGRGMLRKKKEGTEVKVGSLAWRRDLDRVARVEAGAWL